ncbi:SLC5 family protein [Congregibacter sp.]|jgi:SSS family solute:Na+ symporter|uniref:SLC5 family protein n=1 Tax=Congregibacter sp. TaxID=2744308 RepID=UPI0039E538EB
MNTQFVVFAAITAAIAVFTYLQCRKAPRSGDDNAEYFLAGRTLSWYFIAGSITLTNLSTDQLVGMNGNQMLLLAWWELAAVVGLLVLAFVFVPIYYHYDCATTTELLEKRYGRQSLRSLVSILFLMGNVFLYLPIMLYTGSLFLKSMFGLEASTLTIACALATLGSSYAIFGGLRAVAVSDTLSGIGLLSLSLLVVWLSLDAIDFDFSGIPAERLTMIGGPDSPIPWTTLFTGMLFIQIFYWSTNQTITQRAMAAPNVKEAQRGVLAAAAIRLLIVPAIIVIPGICAYKLYGDIGDATFGTLVADLLPGWLSGTFAAMMVAAVLTSFNSVLNSSSTLYVIDLHEPYVNKDANVHRLNVVVSIVFVACSLFLVPVYDGAESIINLVQQLNGLLSMPILSVFIVGLVFSGVAAGAAGIALVSGVALYAIFSFVWTPIHYIHLMAVTLFFCIAVALISNRLFFNGRAKLSFGKALPV